MITHFKTHRMRQMEIAEICSGKTITDPVYIERMLSHKRFNDSIETVHIPGLVCKEEADALLEKLLTKIDWEERLPRDTIYKFGEYNRVYKDFPEIIDFIKRKREEVRSKYTFHPCIDGVLITNHPDGNSCVWPHMHIHSEFKISLGAPRIVVVEEKEYTLSHGDAIIFGPNREHSVIPSPDITTPNVCIVAYYTWKEGVLRSE